jgi:hypothetical protein
MLKLMLLSLAMMLLMIQGTIEADERATESRLDEVQRRGAQVMPFSLEQTIHIFTKTDKGGVQQVIAKENADAEQIGLIQAHLSKISSQFKQGDFSEPAKIHGDDMPGLATLRQAGPGQISIEYKELRNGAQISYSAEDPNLIEPIHQWFDAQLTDHARHAIPGHTHDPSPVR